MDRAMRRLAHAIGRKTVKGLPVIGIVALALSISPAVVAQDEVTRGTLSNHMRVVIVRNTLAPTVTVTENYLAGGDETPRAFPGMAHAQEHMESRGCSGLSANQIAAIFAQLGGGDNAQTEQDITQFFETVSAQDLEIALRVDAACMRGVTDSQAEWSKERGAIEQEVASDISDPTYEYVMRAKQDLFAGTPYAHDALGTKASFDLTDAAMLKAFYRRWYAPNNAILVITGNVDPQKTLAMVEKVYGSIPSRPVPPRPAFRLQPVRRERFTLHSDSPYTMVLVAYRLPGSDSPDFAAARVLTDVLASERANIYELVPEGKALEAGFELVETYRKASMAIGYATIPAGGNPSSITSALLGILAAYSGGGVSAELVEAAKRRELSDAEAARSSLPDLASLWSDSVASEGRRSPQDDVDAIQRVSVADVNRVAKTCLLNQSAVIGTLLPAPSGKASAHREFRGKEKEKVMATPSKPVRLPPWAESLLKQLQIPSWDLHPADMRLKNGIRLIVQQESVSKMVTVVGEIRHQDDLETPPGQEGADTILDNLFSYGTTSLDRLGFQKALDDIAASESAGSSFSLQVLHEYFDRGVQLLANNELQPALPESAFEVEKQQTAQALEGLLKSPDYRAERELELGLLPPNDPELRQATPESVSSLTLKDVKRYYGTTFRPDLTTIVVVGAVTPEEARGTFEKWFGNWTASGPTPEVDLPSVPPNRASATDVPDPKQIQDSVDLAEEIPMNRFNPDYYPLELGNHVLGGGFYATRLERDLREKTGYVYDVSNDLDAGRTRTTFSISFASDPANVSKARALVQRDLADMQAHDASTSELQQAKALLIRQIPLAESSESDIAEGLLDRSITGVPLDEPILAAKRYSIISADEVRAAFAKWIRPNDFVEVVQGPPPQ
jgi:zinc protease